MSQLMRSGIEFAAWTVCADSMLQRLRIVQTLGSVEDFDGGEGVGGVVVEGDGELKVVS